MKISTFWPAKAGRRYSMKCERTTQAAPIARWMSEVRAALPPPAAPEKDALSEGGG